MPQRVLVADEAPFTRAVLAEAVNAFDSTIEVVDARNGRQALEILLEQAPDITFINIKLPELTGAEALAYVRSKGVQTCAVVMSDLVTPDWVEIANELDAYEFLKKPIDPDHIKHLLTGYRHMRRPKRLLLVEDSHVARQLVRRVLAKSRFTLEVDETDSGSHALKMLKLAPYDVALIDFNLADSRDGLETACQANRDVPETKLVLMSGYETTKVAQVAPQFGVKAFLKKPFYSRDIDDALYKALDLRSPSLLSATVEGVRLRPTATP